MKNIIIMLLMVIMIMIAGCTANKENIEDVKEDVNEIKENVEEAIVENILSDLIPIPEDYFLNSEIDTLASDDSYSVYLDHVLEDEWNDYIYKCVSDGYWVNETYRSDCAWYVNSIDNKYQLRLDRYGDNLENMIIIVTIMEEEK